MADQFAEDHEQLGCNLNLRNAPLRMVHHAQIRITLFYNAKNFNRMMDALSFCEYLNLRVRFLVQSLVYFYRFHWSKTYSLKRNDLITYVLVLSHVQAERVM